MSLPIFPVLFHPPPRMQPHLRFPDDPPAADPSGTAQAMEQLGQQYLFASDSAASPATSASGIPKHRPWNASRQRKQRKIGSAAMAAGAGDEPPPKR